MADNVIGAKVNIAGEVALNGNSSKQIKSQIDSLSNKINFKMNIDKPYFKSQLTSLKLELENNINSYNKNSRLNIKPNLERADSSKGIADEIANYQALINNIEHVNQVKKNQLNLGTTDLMPDNKQQNANSDIIQSWKDIVGVVSDATNNIAFMEELQSKYIDAIGNKTENLSNGWDSFYASLINSDFSKVFVELSNRVLDIVNVMGNIGDGFDVKSIKLFLNTFNDFYKIIPILQQMQVQFKLMQMDIRSAGGGIKGFFAVVGGAMKEFMAKCAPILIISTLITLMSTLEGKAAGFSGVIVGALTLIAMAVLLTFKKINKATYKFMSSNFIGWILAALTAVVAVIKGIIELVNAFNPSFEKLKEAAKESVDAWKEAEDQLNSIKDKIIEIEDELKKLNELENPTLIDEEEKENLESKLALLKQQQAVAESIAADEKRNAANANAAAMDKLIKDYEKKEKKNNKKGKETTKEEQAEFLQELGSFLEDYEYGESQMIDSYFDYYYKGLDSFSMKYESAEFTWESLLPRGKNKEAVNALKEYAQQFKNTGDITGDSLKKLADSDKSVSEFFAHLIDIGMWDGSSWNTLIELVGELRVGLEEIATIDMSQSIDEISDKFNTLQGAISDFNKSGVLSLSSLKDIMEKYPSLLDKYFTLTEDGYKLSEKYQGMSDFDLMQDVTVTSLKEYQNQLTSAKKALSELTEADDDYETALKNVAIAQDNLDTASMVWATQLRDLAVSNETEKLEGLKSKLEEQLNIYKETIEIRKDLLQTYKDELNYQKELTKKQKNIADLKTQLSLAKLDTSASGQARARELENQLQSAQEELDEYTLERAIQDITNSLDNEYSEYEAFIKEQVNSIGTQIGEITKKLDGILTGIEGLSNTQYSGKEMNSLYSSLKEKQEKGMKIDGDTKKFMDSYIAGNYKEADKHYASAKNAVDNYNKKIAESETKKEPSEIEKIRSEIKVINGAEGSGMAANKSGDDGIIKFNKTNYEVENGGETDNKQLIEANYDNKGVPYYGDRTIFYYKGVMYGVIDKSVIKIHPRKGNFGETAKKGYNALIRATSGSYHEGGFVGNISRLQTNEEFAKLLKGELVSTPKQMDNFMQTVLPNMLSYNKASGESVINYNSPLVEIKCGEIDRNSMPQLKALVDQAVSKIEKNMESALTRSGYKKTTKFANRAG